MTRCSLCNLGGTLIQHKGLILCKTCCEEYDKTPGNVRDQVLILFKTNKPRARKGLRGHWKALRKEALNYIEFEKEDSIPEEIPLDYEFNSFQGDDLEVDFGPSERNTFS